MYYPGIVWSIGGMTAEIGNKILAENRATVVIFPPQNHGNVPEPVWWDVGVCLIHGTIKLVMNGICECAQLFI
jgi:hypothetical protein